MGTSEDEDVRRKFSRIFGLGRPRTSIFEKFSDGQGEDRDGDGDGKDVDVLRRPGRPSDRKVPNFPPLSMISTISFSLYHIDYMI